MMRDLPHVVATASGLHSDSQHRAELLRQAIDAELMRRYSLLASANARDADEYAEIRLAERDLEPLPILLVIVEEYLQIVADHPLWADLIENISQMGRSANVFFMLGAQRWDMAIMSKIDDNIGFRIALRTDTVIDSRMVIDCNDAALLPVEQAGHALLKVGKRDVEPFRILDVSEQFVAPKVSQDETVSRTDHSKVPPFDVLHESIMSAAHPARTLRWPDFEVKT